MSFEFMKLVVDWDGAKYNSRLEIGDESTTPVTPVDLRFKVPGYIENVHTIFFQNYSSGTNVPRIYGDATNLVFYDNHDTTNQDGVKLADLVSGMGETLWESSSGETYLTTPEHINLKGYALRGSNVSGGSLVLVANSVDVGKIYCQDMLDVQNNDIVNINSINGRDTTDLVFYGATQAQNGTNEFMRWVWDGQKLLMNNTLNMGGNGITNVGGITMSDAINMGGNGISNTYVIKANGASGVEFRPYNYAASGDELLNIADNGFAFIAGANASMGGNDLSYVKTINGTTTIPLHLNFCGNEPATHEIWREGDDLKFKDATATGTKTLSQLAADGGSSTFIGLSDTPPDYTDADGKFVKVSSSNTLEFVAGSSGESLWESPASETYLTTPEPINLKGQPLRGSNASGGSLVLVANSVDSGTIYCQDMLDVQGNDIDDIGSLIFRTSLTSAYIAFDAFDWLKYDCTNNVYEFSIGAGSVLSIGLESISCGAGIDMGNRNITGPSYIEAFDVYGIDLKNSAGTTRGILAHTNYALQCEGVGINMNGQDVECVDVISGCGTNDLRFYDDVVHNFVTLSQLVGGGSGESLWEDMGTYVQLIQDDHLSMRSKNITNLLAPVYGTDAANKDYVDRFLPLSGGSSHPMTDDLYMGGHSIRDMGARYGKLNTLQQWYYNSSGGGVVKKMELNAIAMDMLCPLNMNGNVIDDVDVVKAYGSGGVEFKQHNTDTIMMQVAYPGYAFIANANASMNTHDIINIGTLKGVAEHDLKFYDDVLCTDGNPVTLSELAAGGSTYWEEVDANTIRPIGHHTIQGIDTDDLYIKPASGHVIYIG